jgi:hypothetical protein
MSNPIQDVVRLRTRHEPLRGADAAVLFAKTWFGFLWWGALAAERRVRKSLLAVGRKKWQVISVLAAGAVVGRFCGGLFHRAHAWGNMPGALDH